MISPISLLNIYDLELISIDLNERILKKAKDIYLIKRKRNGEIQHSFYIKYRNNKFEIAYNKEKKFEIFMIERLTEKIYSNEITPIAEELIDYLLNESTERINLLLNKGEN